MGKDIFAEVIIHFVDLGGIDLSISSFFPFSFHKNLHTYSFEIQDVRLVYGLTPLSNNIPVILWRSVYWWGKPEYPEKTADLLQVTDKLYHIMLDRVHLT